ncbi:MAG: sodium:solute symporter family protein [Azospirillum sp.]|nr:sodium:solute symporter family protein [Azospirillum sp.]
MSAKVIWLFAFVICYWAYCISMGLKGMRMVKTASDYFIAGRRLGLWVFILAATATSFSGWTFMGHPGLVYRDGFQYAYASFYTITIPFTGVMFLKRQWMIGKRWGYVTPGEMLSDYFQGDGIRILTVIVALLFSIPYLGVQLGASGFLFNVLTDGLVPKDFGMWLLSIVVLVYVATGGLRAVAYVDTVQCILLSLGIIITGLIALHVEGGWSALNHGLGELAQHPAVDKWKGGEYVSYFAIPGVIQFTAGLGKETPVGGLWTGIMCLTYMWALMGIQSAPAFSMWAFGNKDPRPFAPQQVWASSGCIGFILFFFTAMQGLGGHLLGGNPLVNQSPDMWQSMQESGAATEYTAPADWKAAMAEDRVIRRQIRDQQIIALGAGADLKAQRAAGAAGMKLLLDNGDASGLAGAKFYHLVIPEIVAKQPDALVPYYFNVIGDSMPWLVGLLAVCALAAMQSTGAAYMSTAGSILTRDLYKRYLNPGASHDTQKLFGRLGVAFIVISALMVATFSSDALVLLGGLAVAFGFQMWTPLAGICWFPWITRQGATWGLFAGLLGVIFTESFGLNILKSVGIDLWGRWPWTIHSAGWGMIFNASITVAVSAVTQNADDLAHRMKFHNFLEQHAGLTEEKKKLVPIAWAIAAIWSIFAIGPGAVVGNTIFGAPNEPATWTFGMPSIWAWQVLWWALGVFMMWFLAYKMEMSTIPHTEVEALIEDIGDKSSVSGSGGTPAAAAAGSGR